MSSTIIIRSLMFVLFLAQVYCYHNGAPDIVCTSMAPNTKSSGGHGALPQTTSAPFAIDVNSTHYSKDGEIHVTIKPCASEIEGFMLQARADGSDTPVGKFTSIPQKTKYLACTSSNTTVTHSEELEIEGSHTLEFKWVSGINAPSKNVTFYATLVKGKTTYWVKHESVAILPNGGTVVVTDPANQVCPESPTKENTGYKISAGLIIACSPLILFLLY